MGAMEVGFHLAIFDIRMIAVRAYRAFRDEFIPVDHFKGRVLDDWDWNWNPVGPMPYGIFDKEGR